MVTVANALLALRSVVAEMLAPFVTLNWFVAVPAHVIFIYAIRLPFVAVAVVASVVVMVPGYSVPGSGNSIARSLKNIFSF